MNSFSAQCSISTINTTGIYQRAKLFRHFQVLTAILNRIQKGPPILVIIIEVTVVQALALSALVGNPISDLKYTATLILLTVDCFMVITIILGQMGMVYQKSKRLLKKIQWKQYLPGISVRDKKWERRFYKSCSPLDIMISSVNFVDELTLLNCLQLSLTLTANLLLLN